MRDSSRKYLRRSLLAGTSLVGLTFSAGAALAQSAATQAPETVTVTASRISLAGYQQPTPVAVLDLSQMQTAAMPEVGDLIRQMPAITGGSSPNNNTQTDNVVSGTAGVDTINLRNLGILRTLVLVDSQRIVASNITGGVDLSTIPTALLQRVDVVTGGASAAWGSDAVAGVVNLIINKNFEGLKANLQGGITSQGDREGYKVGVSYGTDFAGGRGHLIVSGQYQAEPDSVYPLSRSWFNGTQLVNNPAFAEGNGQPRYIHANHVGYAKATQGGVIVSGPFANIQFVGPKGTPIPFDPGNVSGLYSNGGDGGTTVADTDALAVPYRNTTLFGYGSYKLTPSIKASLELNYGKSSIENNATPDRELGSATIHADNAFLALADPSLVAAMAAQNVPSFSFGTTNDNNLDVNNISIKTLGNTVGQPTNRNIRQLYRGVVSLDGAFGNWSWNLYYQHGEARIHEMVLHDALKPNLDKAMDAVFVTAANVGSSGLPIGQIACRSTLSDPSNGCQPLDVFGNGVASQAAIDYINTSADFELSILSEDVVSGSVQGQLPWALPAGPISVAFGGDYRKEAGRVTASPLGALHILDVGGFAPFSGSYNVDEGFLEVEVPILKNSIVNSLDFNSAGRITDYSTSGMVETWKLGLTSQINDDFRLRTTLSYDIRAPDLSELFAAGAATANHVIDPHSGNPVSIYDISGGNPNLKPEEASTFSGGVVFTPGWLPGLNMSADWYSIHIHGAINSTGASQELALCNAGNTPYCAQLVFGGPGGALSEILQSPVNANVETTSGLDFQADYAHDLFDGTVSLRLAGNYTDEQTINESGIIDDYAGSLGADSAHSGVPKFKMNLGATYTEGPWSGTVQTRIIGAAKLNNAWGPLDVDDNSVPMVAYMDLRGSFNWSDHVQFYGAVDNVMNVPPPSIPSTSTGSSYLFVATDSGIYDTLGRMFRVGIRFNF